MHIAKRQNYGESENMNGKQELGGEREGWICDS